jgi:hypothetical protein
VAVLAVIGVVAFFLLRDDDDDEGIASTDETTEATTSSDSDDPDDTVARPNVPGRVTVPEFTMPTFPDFTLPSLPRLSIPELSIPESPGTFAPPGSIPESTEPPDGLGDDAALDELAQDCYEGSMQACDDLYDQAERGSDYERYGDTCAGRQPEGTQQYCTASFPS